MVMANKEGVSRSFDDGDDVFRGLYDENDFLLQKAV